MLDPAHTQCKGLRTEDSGLRTESRHSAYTSGVASSTDEFLARGTRSSVLILPH